MPERNFFDFEKEYLQNLIYNYLSSEDSVTKFLYKDELTKYIISHADLVSVIDLNKKLGRDLSNTLHSFFTNLPIHHYTSINALTSILQSKEIRLSQLKDMNDRFEGLIFLEHLKQYLTDNLCFSKDKISNDKTVSVYIRELKSAVQLSYSMSFSFSSEDNAQWERYAENGSGVCLVSSINKLHKAISCLQSENGKIGPITYNSASCNENRLQAYNVINSIMSSIRQPKECFNKIAEYCALLKDPSFFCEHELRLSFPSDTFENPNISNFLSKHVSNDIKVTELHDLQNTDSKSKNKDQLVIKIDEFYKNDISHEHRSFFGMFFNKIVIGPRANKKEKDLVYKLKEQYSLSDIEIEESTSTLK